VDSSYPVEARGFTLVGVPIGSDDYIRAHLRGRLFDQSLWNLGWQLVGMARKNFPAALRIFRGSFTRRFMYLARNVDPRVGAPWFGGFDGLCAWVLERLLHLHGTHSPADMHAHLAQACSRGDGFAAACGGPLILPTLGPAGIRSAYGSAGLPLTVARLPARSGGLGLPQLRETCWAAFVSQLAFTLPPRMLAMIADMQTPSSFQPPEPASDDDTDAGAGDTGADDASTAGDRGLPASHSLPPLLCSARAALLLFIDSFAAQEQRAAQREVGSGTQFEEDGDVLMLTATPSVPPPSPQDPDVGDDGDGHRDGRPGFEGLAALVATGGAETPGTESGVRPGDWEPPASLCRIIPMPLLKWAHSTDPSLRSALLAIIHAADASPTKSICEDWLQRAGLADIAVESVRRRLHALSRTAEDEPSDKADKDPPHVQRELTSAIVAAQRRALDAALRSSGDAGRLARAQLHSQSGTGAWAWLDCTPGRIGSQAAATMILVGLFVDPWRIEGGDCPYCHTTLDEGPTCVHALGCHRQHLRGNNHTHTVQKRALQAVLRRHHVSWLTNEDASVFNRAGLCMDTAVAPGALMLAAQEEFQLKGVLLDTTVRAPTVRSNLTSGAADKPGHAAKKGEDDKLKKYGGTFDADRWILVPFAQETFGRFGERALSFVRVLASHSAACEGGGAEVIKRRRSVFCRRIVVELSLSLARELAERVLAFVRGAAMTGRMGRPVSSLLSTSA
jgi:hypothetical protein